MGAWAGLRCRGLMEATTGESHMIITLVEATLTTYEAHNSTWPKLVVNNLGGCSVLVTWGLASIQKHPRRKLLILGAYPPPRKVSGRSTLCIWMYPVAPESCCVPGINARLWRLNKFCFLKYQYLPGIPTVTSSFSFSERGVLYSLPLQPRAESKSVFGSRALINVFLKVWK